MHAHTHTRAKITGFKKKKKKSYFKNSCCDSVLFSPSICKNIFIKQEGVIGQADTIRA